MSELGRTLIIVGALTAAAGLVLLVIGRVGGWPRLPGDIVVERKNFTLYAPIATCLLLSAILTLILWFLNGRR